VAALGARSANSSFGLGAALGGAILIALAGWAYQKSKTSGLHGRVTAIVTAIAAIALAVVLPLRYAQVAAAETSNRGGVKDRTFGNPMTLAPRRITAEAAAARQFHGKLVFDLPRE